MSRVKIGVLFLSLAAVMGFCGAVPAQGSQDGIVKSSSLSRDSILIGDQTVWNLEIELGEGDSLAILPYAASIMADTAGARIEPLSDFELDTVASGNGVRKLNAKILLTSFDSGSYRLPSPLFIVISGGKADTLKTERPVLSVNTLQIDTAGYVIKDIKGNVKSDIKLKI